MNPRQTTIFKLKITKIKLNWEKRREGKEMLS